MLSLSSLEDIGFGLSITSVILTLFTWTPLNSMVVPMTQQRRKRKQRNNTVFALHSLHSLSSHVIVFNVNIFTYHHCLQCLHTFLGVISGRKTESMRDFYLCYPAILTNTISPSTRFVVNTPKATRGGTRCTYNLPLFGD